MSLVQVPAFNLPLSEEERFVLAELLERTLEEIHLEKRRTEGRAYREQLVHQEAILRTIAERVKQISLG